MENQIAASKSRHQKLVEQEKARIVLENELKNEKQKSADRKFYLNTAFEVMEELGKEFYNKFTRKFQENIRNKRPKRGPDVLN